MGLRRALRSTRDRGRRSEGYAPRVSRPRAAIVAVLLVTAAAAFVRAQDDGCPDPFVMHDQACTIPNELIVLTNSGQDRADVEAAISSSDGQIVFAVEEAGAFTVRYPVDSPAELAPLKASLEASGFIVAYSHKLELFTRG